MIYRDFQGLSLSLLGFGTMRLPTTAAGDVDAAARNSWLILSICSCADGLKTGWSENSNSKSSASAAFNARVSLSFSTISLLRQ